MIDSRPDPKSLGNGPYLPGGVLLRVACRLAQLSLVSQLVRNGTSTLSQTLSDEVVQDFEKGSPPVRRALCDDSEGH